MIGIMVNVSITDSAIVTTFDISLYLIKHLRKKEYIFCQNIMYIFCVYYNITPCVTWETKDDV